MSACVADNRAGDGTYTHGRAAAFTCCMELCLRACVLCARVRRKVTMVKVNTWQHSNIMVCLKYVRRQGTRRRSRTRIGPPCMHARALCATARTGGTATVQGRCLLLHTPRSIRPCMGAYMLSSPPGRAIIHGTHASAPCPHGMDRQPGARARIARMFTYVVYSELRLPYVLAVFFFADSKVQYIIIGEMRYTYTFLLGVARPCLYSVFSPPSYRLFFFSLSIYIAIDT